MPFGPRRPTIALAGGGHAHLYTLRRAGELAGRGFDVALVNSSPYLYYSGMATGVVAGLYDQNETRIDVRRLVEAGGGRFFEGRVERVLPGELLLESGGRVPFDAASFNLGSGTPDRAGPGEDEDVIPVKPVENAARLRDRALTLAKSGGRRVLVAGGGAAGCEVTANLLALTGDVAGDGVRLTLAEAGERLLSEAPARAGGLMRAFLEERGVEVLPGSPVERMRDGLARAGELELPYDLFVSAVGLAPTDVFRRSAESGVDLLTGADGGLWVNRCLQSVSDPRLFGGGDSVAFRGESLPRLGVFAVRQAPVLFHNLQAALRGDPLKPYTPQRRYLYILNLGDGTALAVYGPLVYRGRAALALKHRIDSRFVDV